jgi:hypothetical protein
MNDLLLWLSARKFGSSQAMRAKLAELEVPQATGRMASHRLAEWNLSKLGHVEFGPAAADSGWRVAPPVLAAGEYRGPARAILCGARTPVLVKRLSAAAGTSFRVRQQSSGPDVIEVACPNAPALAQLARQAEITVQWNASLAMLAASASPKSAVLQRRPLPIGGWVVARFSKSQLRWVESSQEEARSAVAGLFRFKAEYGTEYVLVEAGDAYASGAPEGKFRVLRERNRALSYDGAAQELLISSSCRPPLLVERALVLCSGHLPSYRDGKLIYVQVERSIALAVAAVLGQRI